MIMGILESSVARNDGLRKKPCNFLVLTILTFHDSTYISPFLLSYFRIRVNFFIEQVSKK
jgi:hypothetical protein